MSAERGSNGVRGSRLRILAAHGERAVRRPLNGSPAARGRVVYEAGAAQEALAAVADDRPDLVLLLLQATISNLRHMIEPDPSRPAYLLCETGVGYRLRASL